MNLRPSGYEPDELPGCSTPRHHVVREFRLICADAFRPRAMAGLFLPARHEAVDARVRGCPPEPGEAPQDAHCRGAALIAAFCAL